MDHIKFNDFSKVKFKIGEIVAAEEVANSEKLLKLKVYFGEKFGLKTVFSGIKKYYKTEELMHKKTVFIVNMEPRKIMGEFSEAMIFGAESEDQKSMSILILERDLPVGSDVF